MHIPVIRGLIDRRILVNFQVMPEVLSAILPLPFRPKLVDGMGVAGICLIRLKHIRPGFSLHLLESPRKTLPIASPSNGTTTASCAKACTYPGAIHRHGSTPLPGAACSPVRTITPVSR